MMNNKISALASALQIVTVSLLLSMRLSFVHSLKIHPKFSSALLLSKAAENSSFSMPEKIRILALHGKGGSGPQFQSSLQPLIGALELQCDENTKIEFDFITAPFDGGQWWTLPDGVRSFNAKEYEGFESSASLIEETIKSAAATNDDNNLSSGYDFILGHSQGAILLSALIARDETFLNQCFGVKGFLLNGVAWPNPYTLNMESFHLPTKENSLPSSCLFVIGEKDTMNPPEGARRVRECFEKGGMKVSTVDHPGGHSVPVKDDDAVQGIIEWIKNSL